MKGKGFLALLVLGSAFVFFLFVIKGGREEKIQEDVEAFGRVRQELTRTNMTTLEKEIVSFMAEKGRTPFSLKELQRFRVQPVVFQDAWGTGIQYERLSEERFRLISAGRDRIFDTADDVVLGD